MRILSSAWIFKRNKGNLMKKRYKIGIFLLILSIVGNLIHFFAQGGNISENMSRVHIKELMIGFISIAILILVIILIKRGYIKILIWIIVIGFFISTFGIEMWKNRNDIEAVKGIAIGCVALIIAIMFAKKIITLIVLSFIDIISDAKDAIQDAINEGKCKSCGKRNMFEYLGEKEIARIPFTKIIQEKDYIYDSSNNTRTGQYLLKDKEVKMLKIKTAETYKCKNCNHIMKIVRYTEKKL